MSSNYQQITADNIRRRGTEFDDIGNFIAEKLYSDQTHFIYELLQNTEDALRRRKNASPSSTLPRSVTFHLYHNRLEVSHFGQPFNVDDVQGVSDILKGTKHEDTSQIGTFGIGFKSVYAFTATPEIHSGDESFRIDRYIRPTAIPQRKIKDSETVFVFPFDHVSVSTKEAYKRIGDRLKKLEPTTLLFLRNIDTIHWIIEGQTSGIYTRVEKAGGSVRTVTLFDKSGISQTEQKWFVFQKEVIFPNNSGKGYVEIAFQLEPISQNKSRIVPVLESTLNVYFQTEKVTHFGFLLQGPFITTPARDNIAKDEEWNHFLIREASILLKETLFKIREKGYLSVSFLETLPINSEHFPSDSIFRPIYDSVHDCLMNEQLLPTHSGEYIAAKDARFSDSPALRDLFTPIHLQQFFKSPSQIHWIAGDVTQQYSNLRRYIQNELKVSELRADAICRNLEVSFLEQQTDEWMIELYKFLSTQPALWRGSTSTQPRILQFKPFIRLENNQHVTVTNDKGMPNAYIPVDDQNEFPCVKRCLTHLPEVVQFFRDLGMKEPDLAEQAIHSIRSASNTKTIDFDKYKSAIQLIHKALQQCSAQRCKDVIKVLEDFPFILTEIIGNRSRYRWTKRIDAYKSTPVIDEWFAGNMDFSVISTFLKVLPEWDEIENHLKIADDPYFLNASLDSKDDVCIEDTHSCHQKGLNGFNPKTTIEGLEWAVTHPTIKRAEILWHKLLDHEYLIRGIVKSSTRVDYSNSKLIDSISVLGRFCLESHWLPNLNGGFGKPSDIAMDELPDGFEINTERAAKLAEMLGMKGSHVRSLVSDFSQKTQIPESDIQAFIGIYQQDPDGARQWIAAQQKPAFPTVQPANPTRRAQRVQEENIHAPQVGHETRERRIRVTNGDVKVEARVNLRRLYTNEDSIMVCQICKESMPFKLDNDEYYFEVIQCVRNIEQEFLQNYLALCPTCAAKYHHVNATTKNGKDDEELISFINGIDCDQNEFQVPIKLAGVEMTIQFVETHLRDLQITLNGTSQL